MKNVWKKLAILLLLVALNLTFASGCSATPKSCWTAENEIHIPCIIQITEQEDDTVYNDASYVLSNADQILFENLNDDIVNFFKDIYDIDVSEKMSKLGIHFFTNDDPFNFIAGYTPRNSKWVNLNVVLFNPENAHLVASTYLHECMHYLGVTSTEGSPIDEGISEYLAIACAEYSNIAYFATIDYTMYLQVAYQLCAVNEQEIISGYIEDENFNISEHITKVLADVPQVYVKVDDVGRVLSTVLGNIQYYNDDTGFLLAYTAEDILVAYCKTFNPSKDQIALIQSTYILDFEGYGISVASNGDGYEIYSIS